MDIPSDFERALMFEHIRKAAEAAYAKNPLDTEVRAPIFHRMLFFCCFLDLAWLVLIRAFSVY